jgi:dipeptidyl aminopeptidase/acylaminoacyl peptidase
MPANLHERLHDLAREMPPLEVPPDLRVRARRRQVATIAVTATVAITLLVIALTGARGVLRGGQVPGVSPTPSPTPPGAVSGTGAISVAGPGLGVLEVDPSASPGATPDPLVEGQAGPYAWSRDGTRLLFVRTPSFDLWVRDAKGTETQLTTGITVQDASWSPGGERIVLSQDGEIDVMHADGSGRRMLYRDRDAYTADPVWSPDGSTIAFTHVGRASELWVMGADGSHPHALVTAVSMHEYSQNPASWSPDGSRLAFGAYGDDDLQVYVVNADGSGLTQLTHDPRTALNPSWSPDSSQIAYLSTQEGARWVVYVMNADGSDPQSLGVPTTKDSTVLWHPEGGSG